MILADNDYVTIVEQMKDDAEKVLYYVNKEDAKALRKFKKERSYPQWTYSLVTLPDSRNQYLLWFYALNKKEVQDNYFWGGSCLLVNDKDGKRIVYRYRPQKDTDTGDVIESLQVYNGHFFSRYKERMKLSDDLNAYEVMTIFFGRNALYLYGLNNEKVMKKPEKYKDAMAYRIDDGVIFGSESYVPYKNDELHVMLNNTFLSSDILKQSQKENIPGQIKARSVVLDRIFRDKAMKAIG